MSEDLRVGASLDERYRVLGKLGEGGMGAVYLVENLVLQREEALKVVRPTLADDAQFMTRLRREARAINRLHHPNIVTVYDFARLSDGAFYLAMEHVAGATLSSLLRARGPMPVPRALHLLGQLTSAVEHAHGLGVLHRDLKPENLILVESRGRADVLKVIDFGIAKIVAPDYVESMQLTADGDLFGTPQYIAPERFSGQAATTTTDLYAIGCIAMELVTGAPPFSGRMMEVMHAQLSEPPPVPSERKPSAGIPRALDAVVSKLLAKLPADRFSSAAEVLEALRRVPGFGTHRAGVARPRVIPDTQPHAVARTAAGDAFDNERTDERAPRPDPAPLLLRTLTRELAEAFVEDGVRDERLLLALARLQHLEGSSAAHALAQKRHEAYAEAIEQRLAHEVAGMRFVLSDLRFERATGAVPTTKMTDEMSELERELVEAHTLSARDMAVVEERALLMAVEGDKLDEQGLVAATAVLPLLDELMAAQAAPSEPLRLAWRRLEQLRA